MWLKDKAIETIVWFVCSLLGFNHNNLRGSEKSVVQKVMQIAFADIYTRKLIVKGRKTAERIAARAVHIYVLSNRKNLDTVIDRVATILNLRHQIIELEELNEDDINDPYTDDWRSKRTGHNQARVLDANYDNLLPWSWEAHNRVHYKTPTVQDAEFDLEYE